MNISEAINKLEKLKQQHGDIEVKIFDFESEQDYKVDLIGVPKNTKEKIVRIIREE